MHNQTLEISAFVSFTAFYCQFNNSHLLEQCTHYILKANLDSTTLTYNCRMQLAHVIHTTRIA